MKWSFSLTNILVGMENGRFFFGAEWGKPTKISWKIMEYN
jgi:hypothetical protein